MNLYKVTTPTISVCVFAEDANAAIDCFVDELLEEHIDVNESDINFIEQIACERQPRLFKSDFPSRLIVSLNDVKNWLEGKGYKVTRENK